MDINIKSELNLLQVSDPMFPIGSFTLSNGLETYVQKGIVHNSETAKSYLTNYIRDYLPYNDLLLLKSVNKAAKENSFEQIRELDNLVQAATVPREIKEGSNKLCKSFFRVISKFNSNGLVKQYIEEVRKKQLVGHYPIIYGLYLWEAGAGLSRVLTTYAYNVAASIVTNCAKLIPLSQLEGQRVLFEVFEEIEDSINLVGKLDKDNYARCMPAFEIRSMEHERLYARLYIS